MLLVFRRRLRTRVIPLAQLDLSTFDSLPIADPVRRQRLRSKVLCASVRCRAGSEAVAVPVGTALLIVIGAGALVEVLRDVVHGVAPLGGQPFGFWLTTCVILVPFVGWRLSERMRWQDGPGSLPWPPRRPPPGSRYLAGILAGIAVGFCLIVLVADLRQRSVLAPGGADDVPIGSGLWYMAVLVAEDRWRAVHGRPYDLLILELVTVTAALHARSRRLTSTETRRLCRELDHIANRAELLLSMPGRARRSSRSVLRAEARRIAAVFRSHVPAVAAAYDAADVQPIVASLLCSIEALADGDRAALLANAPDAVPIAGRLRRAFARAWPPTVLLASGVALPLIPAVANQPEAASSLRWTLVVAGVLTLAAGKDIAGRVGVSLDRALPWT
ncbi:hypothetical protein ACU639_36815 [Streptomyces cynarae]|uniref:hypothetical protein n=1 Tax=Streptomyces cynarae TaxID=2981134 RepID=UPI00406D4430